MLIDPVNDLLHLSEQGGILEHFPVRGVSNALFCGPGLEVLWVEPQEGRQVLPAIPVNKGLIDKWMILEKVLDVCGGDVLPASRDDDLLLPSRDPQESLAVEPT